MNEEKKAAILSAVEQYNTIIISRHKRPDGDAVGSTLGLARVLCASFPGKRVFLDNEDYAEYTAFLGDEGPHPTDEDYREALVIVIDTGTLDRVSNSRVLSGKYLIKIDHHIDLAPYGDLSWVEEERSSSCEMITAFCLSFPEKLKLDVDSATALYAGMVTDSGRFKYEISGGEPLRMAAALMDQGIDTETLYAHLYLEDYKVLQFHADLMKRVQVTENGVAWLYVTKILRRNRDLSIEEASNTVSLMDSIKGALIWIAFIENDDGSVRVRLRSRYTKVSTIANRYNGGGHERASGATVYSKKEAMELLRVADVALKGYRTIHPEKF